jgi:hypothetical protein
MANIPVACLAPPLADETLDRYEALLNETSSEVRDALEQCLACVRAWWELPESSRRGERWLTSRVNAAGDGYDDIEIEVAPLERARVEELWDVTPWPRELQAMKPLFETLPPGELRDAAHHLLWHAIEIALDREPLTMDKLPT